MSLRFIKFMRSKEGGEFGLTGTCRTNSGVAQQLIDLKKLDDKDVISWGETYSVTTEDGLVCQVGFKDNAFVLFMSTVWDGGPKVSRERKRPKESSSKAKTSRIPFGDLPKKVLQIPMIVDRYNYQIGAVDQFDHLTANNPGIRPIRRGGHQALEHWLLRTVLINSYLLALHASPNQPTKVRFRSQVEFRRRICDRIFAMTTSHTNPNFARRIAHMDPLAMAPLHNHQNIKMASRAQCCNCKGGRISDRPLKRSALAEIAANHNRESISHYTFYICTICKVRLCNYKTSGRRCWDIWHQID